MAQGWKRIPLLVIFLFFSNSYGFKSGPYSNAHQQWGQPSDNTLPPRAVQSSVSEVPVTGTLPEEVGSSLFTDRPLKRLNLLQFVKGHDSSGQESTSNAQTAPSSSLFASLPPSSSKKHADNLTSIQGSSGTTITDTARVSTQGESTSFPAILGTSGQSTSDQSPPSLYISSSQDISGVKMAGAALPVFSQSISSSRSSTPGDTGDRGFASTSQGGSRPELSVSSRQSITTQAGGSYRVSQSLSTSNQYTPGSLMYKKSVLPVGISSQSPSTQSRPGSPLTSSNFFPVQEGSSSISRLSLSQGTLGLSAPPSPSKHASVPISHLTVYSQATRSSGAQFGASAGFASQGMGSIYSGSVRPQDTTNQFAPGSPSPSVSQFLPQGTASPSSTAQSSQKQVASTFTGSSGTQSRSSMLLSLEGSTTNSGSLQPQGTTNRFAPGSPSSYPSASLSSPQGAASQPSTAQSSRKQVASTFTGSSGTQSRSSMLLSLEGSTTNGGSLQPQGTTNRFAPGSPSSYPSASLSSPQGAASQPTTVQSSQKQVASTFTGSSGTLSGSSMPLSLQRIPTYGGSLQPQGTTNQFAPGSPSPSVPQFLPQGAASPSSTVQSSKKQVASTFTGSSGTLSGSSMPLSLQRIPTYGGSLQPQGTTNQFAPGSPSPSVPQFLPQGAASPSSTVQSSKKQVASTFTGSSGTLSGSSMPLSLQRIATYGGSLQPQGTTNRFAPGSPSSYPSASLSSPQGAASQPATVQSSQKQVASTFTGSSGTLSGSSMPLSLQRIATYAGSLQPQGTTNRFAPGSPSSYPSASLSSPQGAASQSATVQSSQKRVASTFTGSSGTLSGSSMPLSLQRIPTYGGSLQPQGTTNQFAPGSPSPSVPQFLPQGAASPSSTVQSSKKQVASTFTGSSGTLSGSSMPLSLQRIATYGGSLQPQGTTNRFAPGSPSSYPSASLSSPQGAASQPSTAQSSRKQVASTFTGSSGTQSRSSMLLSLEGSTTNGGSLQPQGTTNRFAPGSPSSYPSASLSSPQGAASQPTTVQSSQKQVASTFTGSSGTLSGSSMPLSLQRIATYGGSLQPQGTTNRFAPGSPSSYPSASLSSPQGATSQPATVQSSQKQVASTFTSSSGTLSGSSMPLSLQRIATYGGSLQPQGTTNRFAPGSPSSYQSVLSSHQGVASPPSQALQSHSVSQSLKSQRWQPSQGNPTSLVPASQGSSLSQSSRMQSRFSSLSSAGGTSSRDSGRFVPATGGSTSYGGASLLSQSPFNKHTPGSQAYAKFVPLPLAVSSQSTSDQHSNGLYSSDSLQTQGHLDVVEKPSSQAPPVKFQRPTGYNQAHSLGLSAQAASVSVLSEIPQTPQAPSESGSEGAQILKPSELLHYQPGVYGQGTLSASASQFFSGYGSVSNQNAPASTPSRISFSSRYQSVKG